MFLFDIIVLFDIYDILYMIYILNKAPNHKFLPCLYCKVKTIQYYREAQQSNDPPLSKHKATVGKKNSLLTGRNFQRNQAQKGAAIRCDWLGAMEMDLVLKFCFKILKEARQQEKAKNVM